MHLLALLHGLHTRLWHPQTPPHRDEAAEEVEGLQADGLPSTRLVQLAVHLDWEQHGGCTAQAGKEGRGEAAEWRRWGVQAGTEGGKGGGG